jgi:hypothetical protein
VPQACGTPAALDSAPQRRALFRAVRAAGEYTLDMVPYDDDVISLELDTAFYDCVCEGDCTPLYHMAAAITRLQAMFGVIPRMQVRHCPGADVRAGARERVRRGRQVAARAAPRVVGFMSPMQVRDSCSFFVDRAMRKLLEGRYREWR